MGRNQVWKGKAPSFRRLLEEVAAEADVLRAKGQAWRAEGLASWPLPRVLWRLAELGVPCAKEESFLDALAAGSPHGLASLWGLGLRAEGEVREFLEYATDVVWEWHFPNGGGPDADFLVAADFAIEDDCREDKLDEAHLRRRAEAAMRVAKSARTARPEDPADWVAMMEERCRVPVATWAAELVIHLGAGELPEEGIALAEAWVPVALTERFRAELPILLASAGRIQEAKERVEALLRDYPRSLPSLFMAGEALVAMGKREEGYAIVQRAMALAQSREERLWIRDHLEGLATLIEEDRKAEPAAVFDEEDPSDDDVPLDPIVAEARVGRNDPCPCGSGKKYK